MAIRHTTALLRLKAVFTRQHRVTLHQPSFAEYKFRFFAAARYRV